jgi:hypothetical protein
MSFTYPRVISIRRPGGQPMPSASVGFQGPSPSGEPDKETAIGTGIRCSIQARREGTKGVVGLPADATLTTWWILIPKSALAFGTIQENDIVYDDLGERYQIVANYWNSLGYRISVQKLAA